MNRAIPNINTAHLTLRGMRLEDFDRYAAIWADQEVVAHIGGVPRSRAQSWEAFLRIAGHWQMTGFGQWAVIDQKSRMMIGQVGFFFGTGAVGVDFDPFPQAGWVLVPEAHHKGLGQEATRAAHDWFDRIMPGPLVAKITAENDVSRRLARYLGYHEMRDLELDGESLVLMRRDGPPVRT